MAKPGSTNWTMLWMFLLVAGGTVMWGASQMSSDHGALHDVGAGEQMMSTLRASGEDTSRKAISIFGGLLGICGLLGLVRVWTTDAEPSDADPAVVHGLSGPPRRPARASESPPGTDGAASPAAQWTDEVEFDPTRWEQPAGMIFVVDGRSAGPLYEAARRVATDAGAGGLLAAMLQGLNQRERKLVVVLGGAGSVATFGSAWRTFVDGGAGGDWERLRPDQELARGAPAYDAMRSEIRAAGFMVLAAGRT